MGDAPTIDLEAWKRFIRRRVPGSFPIEPFHELVYDPAAAAFIKDRWPNATITDASDIVHEGRFSIEIPGITGDDFYPAVILEGWASACLAFEISMRLPEQRCDVQRWIERAAAMKDATDAAA